MGCAGGVDGEITMAIHREDLPSSYITRELVIKGLKGGHSGCDIHTGRANANKLMGRFLTMYAQDLGLRLSEIRGGSLRNAIPREAFATIALPESNQQALEAAFNSFTDLIKSELGKVETDIVSFNQPSASITSVMAANDQSRLINLLNSCPNGVMRMSDDIEGVVETSLNVGVITTEETHVSILCLIRSLIDSGREQVEQVLTSLATLAGAELQFSGAYPGWKPDADSEIMAVFRDMYNQIYGHKPNIMVIHAGLECGLFKKPYPQMDMVSFGPTIKFPHSPDEKVKIDTVGLFWQQMTALLEAIPEKA
jgi:dipeptidase D